MDGRIMRCGVISSCQSAATSEIVKRSWACVHRGTALYKVPDLYLLFNDAYAKFSSITHPWRSCISWFERISMTIILFNCVTLGMYEPCADSAACVTVRCRILEAFDHAIFVFFAAEMCIKVLAMGLIGKSTYLAETWNCLDMFIVITGSVLRLCYPAPGRGRGIVFGRFLSLFLCQQRYEKTAGPICMKLSGKVWSDHGTTWLHFGSIRVNGSAGQRSICLLLPARAQRTGVNKSVSFARWQQGAGFVVPRTTACYYYAAVL